MTDIASNPQKIQVESLQSNQAVSESALQAIGGSINYILDKIFPVGTILMSDLSETSFQTEIGNSNWVLCDGRSVVGSRFQTLTGRANISDLRGVYIRGRDYTRGITPEGDQAPGTYLADTFASHSHTFTLGGYGSDNNPYHGPYGSNGSGSYGNWSTNNTGSAETRPKSVVSNFFVRIN